MSNENSQGDGVNPVTTKQDINENISLSSNNKQDKENAVINKNEKDQGILSDGQKTSMTANKDVTVETGNSNVSETLTDPSTVVVNDGSVNKIKEETKTSIDVPKTPLQLNLISQSQIKNSPNVSMQLTDKMIEEEERYKKEDQEQMEKVKAEVSYVLVLSIFNIDENSTF